MILVLKSKFIVAIAAALFEVSATYLVHIVCLCFKLIKLVILIVNVN